MEAMIVVLIVLVVGWSLYLLVDAHRTHTATYALTPAEVQEEVSRLFQSKLWGRAAGPGMVNAKALRPKAPVFSIDWTPAPAGGTTVDIWVSEAWRNGLGMRAHPFFIWRKKRKLLRRLRAASSSVAAHRSGSG